jgi:hypothetical protein
MWENRQCGKYLQKVKILIVPNANTNTKNESTNYITEFLAGFLSSFLFLLRSFEFVGCSSISGLRDSDELLSSLGGNVGGCRTSLSHVLGISATGSNHVAVNITPFPVHIRQRITTVL